LGLFFFALYHGACYNFAMAKLKTSYACSGCGAVYPRWQGKCSACNEWNTIEEDVVASTPSAQLGAKASKAKASKVTSLFATEKQAPRIHTGMAELDRVLGGGLVPGSAILIGGDPGIGKSTILLQLSANLAANHKVLYMSGEESHFQIQMRAKRLGVEEAPIQLSNLAVLETALATIRQEKPTLVIIDSIQTMYAEALESAPGTVSQVRLAAHELTQAAKQSGSIVIFVGHVTKDGNIAGPRVLEHMVDTVLYFEGDRGHAFRLLRSFKNRFGATNEIGVFDMTETGLQEVTNPSALFLSERPDDATGSAILAAMNGTRPVLMEVQALVSATTLAQPRRTTLGVDPARVAMIAAVLDKHAGYTFSNHDIFLNVTGGMKVNEPAADMAIAAALVSSLMNKVIPHDTLVLGELGLSGEIRNVNNMQQRLKEAEKLGFKKVLSPPLGKDIKKGKLTLNRLPKISEIGNSLFE